MEIARELLMRCITRLLISVRPEARIVLPGGRRSFTSVLARLLALYLNDAAILDPLWQVRSTSSTCLESCLSFIIDMKMGQSVGDSASASIQRHVPEVSFRTLRHATAFLLLAFL